jgi:single-strand DNA-binding protein
MYRNNISLIGFAGKDAEARTTNNQKPYTVLSVATQSSYKDKSTGDYVNRTEWHRVIVWGKLGEFAKKIQKGAHLAVDGELISREFTDKKHSDVKHRIWEVRATSILKLDRAEKAGSEEQADDEFNPEEEAE